MAKKKKAAVKPAAAKKEEPVKTDELSGFHRMFPVLKGILIISLLGNIYYFLRDGISGTDLWDTVFNVFFLIMIVLSLVWHNRRKGVYCFFAYGIVELIYEYIICFLAWKNGVFDGAVGNRLMEYTVFTAVILIPLFFYYRKRIHLLEP